ncbi:tetratricopeptide repeat protein [Dongia deserti]|uniref:tetratricopeptide repeat protein n=1 Tax=Dongia deserti TaxID=2268030 RepID=UPI000E6554F0|nr:tetratricopeptide repeat protein [Dongia deserti]
MSLLERDPGGALDSAVEWERQGGGDAARHCKALALIRTGEVEDGALELERVAQAMPQDKAPLAAELFAQAGQAWIKAGNPQRALYTQDQGLKLDPNNVELLIDRALTYGTSGMYFEALDDLNAAVDLSPNNPDVYAMRAAAYRQLENPDLAEDNIEQALKLSPSHPAALLERGYLRRAKGDVAGARTDWLTVIQVQPGTDLASEAQKNIQKLDIR